jgi:hypothetical protein
MGELSIDRLLTKSSYNRIYEPDYIKKPNT